MRKAEAGVRVVLLVWSDISDQMGTHDNETFNFFKGKHDLHNNILLTSLQTPEWSAALCPEVSP